METEKREVTRDTVLIAIFGALWGLMEITLGMTLKGLRIPFSGAILTSLACVIFLTGKYFVPGRGSVLMMGAVAAVLKVFSVGTVIAGPFMAILIEALIAELLLSLLGINLLSYLFTPVLLLLYTIVHPFISQGIIFGSRIYSIYLQSFEKFSEIFGISTDNLLLIVLAYAGLHAAMGLTAGTFAYILTGKVKRELNKHKQFSGDFL